MTIETDLPKKEELITALSTRPLGNGSEARVYKIPTNPQLTLRVSHDLDGKDLSQQILEAELTPEKDIFSGRRFGQTIAYLKHPQLIDHYSEDPLITVNYYSPGHDYTIVKNIHQNPTEQETLDRTIATTRMLLDPKNFPDSAYDALFDKLKFLSSKQYTIDVGNELVHNTSNILPSVEQHEFFIIDVMPFIPAEKLRLMSSPSLNPNHTKASNSPFFLTRGLMYGHLEHQPFHSKSQELTDLRIQLLHRIIDAATRSKLSDKDTYMFDSIIPFAWNRQLTRLNIPKEEQTKLMEKIENIQDTQPYPVVQKMPPFARIGGFYINQQ